MLNKSFLQGRMTKDPEIRQTNSGKAVALFALAVERDFKDSSGERGVDFINCVAYDHVAEFIKNWFHKGSMAVVVGRLQIRDWTDREGNKRQSSEIVCESVYFGDSKRTELKPAGAPVNVQYTEPDDADHGTLPWE